MVGSRARAKREALGQTQQELADAVGVTHQHISRIESGQASPSIDLVVRLASTFGVTTDELLTGADRVPVDVLGAIRGDRQLSAAAKRHLMGLLKELRRLSKNGDAFHGEIGRKGGRRS